MMQYMVLELGCPLKRGPSPVQDVTHPIYQYSSGLIYVLTSAFWRTDLMFNQPIFLSKKLYLLTNFLFWNSPLL
jgi:hypothetical protein